MHSCELITNLRAKKVLCHRIEVARISGATTTDCVFCNVIGYRRITPGKALSNQLNEDRGIGRRSPDPFSLERGRGLGTRLMYISLVPRPLPDFISQLIFLHRCKIKSGSGLGTRLHVHLYVNIIKFLFTGC